jgi:hypothetical protein
MTPELNGRGLVVDYHTIWAFVRAEGLRYKNMMVAIERNRPYLPHRRTRWLRYYARHHYGIRARSKPLSGGFVHGGCFSSQS